MRLLSLDLSTHIGWAVTDDGKRIASGTVDVPPAPTTLSYPWDYNHRATVAGEMVGDLYHEWKPNEVAIEETNGGKNRYSQKLLEWIHHKVLIWLKINDMKAVVRYVNTSDWRKVLGLKLSKDQRKANAKLGKAKREGGQVAVSATKKALGLKGKTNQKHLAVAFANERFGLSLKQKDNNEADALAMAEAVFLGVPFCDGK